MSVSTIRAPGGATRSRKVVASLVTPREEVRGAKKPPVKPLRYVTIPRSAFDKHLVKHPSMEPFVYEAQTRRRGERVFLTHVTLSFARELLRNWPGKRLPLSLQVGDRLTVRFLRDGVVLRLDRAGGSALREAFGRLGIEGEIIRGDRNGVAFRRDPQFVLPALFLELATALAAGGVA